MRRSTTLLVTAVGAAFALGNEGQEALHVALVCAATLLVAMPLALYVSSTLPTLVERAAETRRTMPLWSLLLGLGDAIALLALAATVGRIQPIGAIFVLLLASLLLGIGIVGLAGTARSLGQRLLALGDRPASPLRQLCWGWLLLAGIPLLPILGILVLLYLLPGAIGAGHLALHGRKRSATVA